MKYITLIIGLLVVGCGKQSPDPMASMVVLAGVDGGGLLLGLTQGSRQTSTESPRGWMGLIDFRQACLNPIKVIADLPADLLRPLSCGESPSTPKHIQQPANLS
jgi:hypothetical protein